MSEVVKVGMADLNTVSPPGTIRTSGLGSCVGVVLYDEITNVSGMAHVMLPSSTLCRQEKLNPAKYADTAIPFLIKKLVGKGAKRPFLKAKLAGGAQMFTFSAGSMMKIGPRNVEAVKKALKELNIPVIAEDVGGNSGRTIEFNPASKLLNIRTVNQGIKDI
ncbi:chemotaxis protein CheD [bacterium LRH843]|nr:chemotaxis protein CheD [bacterium LRH843]